MWGRLLLSTCIEVMGVIAFASCIFLAAAVGVVTAY